MKQSHTMNRSKSYHAQQWVEHKHAPQISAFTRSFVCMCEMFLESGPSKCVSHQQNSLTHYVTHFQDFFEIKIRSMVYLPTTAGLNNLQTLFFTYFHRKIVYFCHSEKVTSFLSIDWKHWQWETLFQALTDCWNYYWAFRYYGICLLFFKMCTLRLCCQLRRQRASAIISQSDAWAKRSNVANQSGKFHFNTVFVYL